MTCGPKKPPATPALLPERRKPDNTTIVRLAAMTAAHLFPDLFSRNPFILINLLLICVDKAHNHKFFKYSL